MMVSEASELATRLVNDGYPKGVAALRETTGQRYVPPADSQLATGHIEWPKIRSILDTQLYGDDQFIAAKTILLYVDNRDLANATKYPWWGPVARLAAGRTRYHKASQGPREEWFAALLLLDGPVAIGNIHQTWASVPILYECVTTWPGKNWILMDTDCAVTGLYDIEDLKDMLPHPQSVGMICVSENVSAINAGIVMVMAEKEDPTARWDPGNMEEEYTNQLAAAIRRATEEGGWAGHTREGWDPYCYAPFQSDTPTTVTGREWERLDFQRMLEHSPFHGVTARRPRDFVMLWTALCSLANAMGFPYIVREGRVEWLQQGSSELLSAGTQGLRPAYHAWAGPQFEQGGLQILQAFQSDDCTLAILPHAGFMRKKLRLPTAAAVPPSLETADMHCPPLHVHCMGAGGKVLLRQLLRINYFRTIQHSLEGGLAKSTLLNYQAVSVSTGMTADLSPEFMEMVAANGGNPRQMRRLQDLQARWILTSGDPVALNPNLAHSLTAQTASVEACGEGIELGSFPVNGHGGTGPLPRPIVFACCGLGGTQVDVTDTTTGVMRKAHVTFRNMGYQRSYGPGQKDRDEYEDWTLRPHIGTTDLCETWHSASKDPVMQAWFASLMDSLGLQWATPYVQPESSHPLTPMHAHLSSPATNATLVLDFLCSIIAGLTAGEDEDLPAIQVVGHSAGSYTAMWITDHIQTHWSGQLRLTQCVASGLACPAETLLRALRISQLTLIHVREDRQCVMNVSGLRALADMVQASCRLVLLTGAEAHPCFKAFFGADYHAYEHFMTLAARLSGCTTVWEAGWRVPLPRRAAQLGIILALLAHLLASVGASRQLAVEVVLLHANPTLFTSPGGRLLQWLDLGAWAIPPDAKRRHLHGVIRETFSLLGHLPVGHQELILEQAIPASIAAGHRALQGKGEGKGRTKGARTTRRPPSEAMHGSIAERLDSMQWGDVATPQALLPLIQQNVPLDKKHTEAAFLVTPSLVAVELRFWVRPKTTQGHKFTPWAMWAVPQEDPKDDPRTREGLFPGDAFSCTLMPTNLDIYGVVLEKDEAFDTHRVDGKVKKRYHREAVTRVLMVVHYMKHARAPGGILGTAENLEAINSLLKSNTTMTHYTCTPGAAPPGILQAACELDPLMLRILRGSGSLPRASHADAEAHKVRCRGVFNVGPEDTVPQLERDELPALDDVMAPAVPLSSAPQDTPALPPIDGACVAQLLLALLSNDPSPVADRILHNSSEELLNSLREAAQAEDGVFAAMLTCIASQLAAGSRVIFLAGVPGAGKTHAFCLLQLALHTAFDWPIHHVSEGNSPLDSALLMFDKFTAGCDSLRERIARFPAKSHEVPANPLLRTFDMRGKWVERTQIAIMSFGAIAADLTKPYSPFRKLPKAKVGFIDEAQGFWHCLQAIFSTLLQRDHILIFTGDAKQPPGSTTNLLEQVLMSQATSRGAGLHSPDIRYSAPSDYVASAATALAGLELSGKYQHWRTAPPPMQELLRALADGMEIREPTTIHHTAGQAKDSPPHVLLSASQRLNLWSSSCLSMTNIYEASRVGDPDAGTLELGVALPRVAHQITLGKRHLELRDPPQGGPPLALNGPVLFDTSAWPDEKGFWAHRSLVLGALSVLAPLLRDHASTDRPIGVVSPYRNFIVGLHRDFPASSAAAAVDAATQDVRYTAIMPMPIAARRHLNLGDGVELSEADWLQWFRTGRNKLAPFLKATTAMSGGGATYSAVLVFMIRHNWFTRMQAPTLVALTRGEMATLVFAPTRRWPSTSFLGRFLAPALAAGGLAGTVPRCDDPEDTTALVSNGLYRAAALQALTVPNYDWRTHQTVLDGWRRFQAHLGVAIPSLPTVGTPPLQHPIWQTVPLALGLLDKVEVSTGDAPITFKPGVYFLCPSGRPLPEAPPVDLPGGLDGSALLGTWYVCPWSPYRGFQVGTPTLHGGQHMLLGTASASSWDDSIQGEKWRSGHIAIPMHHVRPLTVGEVFAMPLEDSDGPAGLIRAYLADAGASSQAQPAPVEAPTTAQHAEAHDKELIFHLSPVNWFGLRQIGPLGGFGRIVLDLSSGKSCLIKEIAHLLRPVFIMEQGAERVRVGTLPADHPALRYPQMSHHSVQDILGRMPQVLGLVIQSLMSHLPDVVPAWWSQSGLDPDLYPLLHTAKFWEPLIEPAFRHALGLAGRPTSRGRTNNLVMLTMRPNWTGLELALPTGLIAILVTSIGLDNLRAPGTSGGGASSSTPVDVHLGPSLGEIIGTEEEGGDPDWSWASAPAEPDDDDWERLDAAREMGISVSERNDPSWEWDYVVEAGKLSPLIQGCEALQADLVAAALPQTATHVPSEWKFALPVTPDTWAVRARFHPVLFILSRDDQDLRNNTTWHQALLTALQAAQVEAEACSPSFVFDRVLSRRVAACLVSTDGTGCVSKYFDLKYGPSAVHLFPEYLHWVRDGMPKGDEFTTVADLYDRLLAEAKKQSSAAGHKGAGKRPRDDQWSQGSHWGWRSR